MGRAPGSQGKRITGASGAAQGCFPPTSDSCKKPDASAGARGSYRGFFYGTLTLSVHIPVGIWHLPTRRLACPGAAGHTLVTQREGQAKLTVQRPLSPPRRWQVSNQGCGFCHRLSTWVQRPLCAVRGSAPEGWGTPTPTEPSPVLDEARLVCWGHNPLRSQPSSASR